VWQSNFDLKVNFRHTGKDLFQITFHSDGRNCLHCELHACTTGWYAAITLTASVPTSTEKNHTL